MNEKKIEEIIARALKSALADNPSTPCRCDIPRAIHTRDHELIAELIDVLERIRNIKWSLLKWLAKWTLAALLILLVLGMRAKLRVFMGLPPS